VDWVVDGQCDAGAGVIDMFSFFFSLPGFHWLIAMVMTLRSLTLVFMILSFLPFHSLVLSRYNFEFLWVFLFLFLLVGPCNSLCLNKKKRNKHKKRF